MFGNLYFVSSCDKNIDYEFYWYELAVFALSAGFGNNFANWIGMINIDW